MSKKENIQLICPDCTHERLVKWQENNKNVTIEKGDFVKIPFKQRVGLEDRVEWMWCIVDDIRKDQQSIVGILDNEPIYVTDVERDNKYRFGRNLVCQHLKRNDYGKSN